VGLYVNDTCFAAITLLTGKILHKKALLPKPQYRQLTDMVQDAAVAKSQWSYSGGTAAMI